jgi:hypothetical protein
MRLGIKAWLALLAIGAIVFIGLGATTIVGWEYSNSSAFCSEAQIRPATAGTGPI